MASLSVKQNDTKNPVKLESGQKPEHWLDAKGSGFHNPWPSWRATTPVEMLGVRSQFLVNLTGHP
jgi:hypothetical protein